MGCRSAPCDWFVQEHMLYYRKMRYIAVNFIPITPKDTP